MCWEKGNDVSMVIKHTPKDKQRPPVPTVKIDEVGDTGESSKIFKVNLEEISSDEDPWPDWESDDDDDEWMNTVSQWTWM